MKHLPLNKHVKAMLILEVCGFGMLIAGQKPSEEEMKELTEMPKEAIAFSLFTMGLEHNKCCIPRHRDN